MPYLERAGPCCAQLEDLALFLRDYRERLQVTPGRLDEIESRLASIERLKKKYGATVEEVLAFGAALPGRAASAGLAREEQRKLERDGARGTSALLRAGAGPLEAAPRGRPGAGRRSVQAELGQLAMEKTRFEVAVQPGDADRHADDPAAWTEQGLETAEFLLSPNPGEELRPLARIASGGELSRIMLALKSVASLDAAGMTLVFDEVDAGIGGRVAEVVGRKLGPWRGAPGALRHPPAADRVAGRSPLRCSQARGARADDDGGRAARRDERVEEVARMLGGEKMTETARHHAREMVNQSLRPERTI